MEVLVSNYIENHLNDILSEEERRQGFVPADRSETVQEMEKGRA